MASSVLARRLGWVAIASLVAACGMFKEPGYDPENPGQVTCGCHDGVTCYEGATKVASARGETPATAEELMYFAQCACFQGSRAGCNTLGHFARDWTRACDAGTDDANACVFAGFIYHHGVQLPPKSGRSFDRNEAAATVAFDKACKAGSKIACDQSGRVKTSTLDP